MNRRDVWCSVLVLAGVLLIGGTRPSLANEYETSVKVAQALEAIYDLRQHLGKMRALDQADLGIKNGACADAWNLFSRTRRDEDRDRLDTCWRNASMGNSSLNGYGIRSIPQAAAAWTHASEEYRLGLARMQAQAAKNPVMGELYLRHPNPIDDAAGLEVLERLELQWAGEETRLLQRYDRVVALVKGVVGDVVLIRPGREIQATNGMEVKLLDRLRTGPRSRVRLRLLDRNEATNSGPSIINLGSDTEVVVRQFKVGFAREATVWQGTVELLRGVIRAFTKNWGGASAFKVRTGTALCGIRGTELDVEYRPEVDEATYVLFKGAVQVEAPGQQPVPLRAGQMLRVVGGMIGPVRSMGGEVSSLPHRSDDIGETPTR